MTTDSLPLVSIIVPVYRQEQYLPQCLESIARQTFSNWECIIVNDGSPDPARIVEIAQYILNDNVVILHQENRGVCSARNTGIEHARGDYFVCLDADDYLHPDFLAYTVPVLDTAHADIVFVWAQYIGIRHDQLQPNDVHLFWLLQRNLITITTLCKRSVWQSVGGFDQCMESGYEDWEFWIRAALAGYRFHGVSMPLVYYRIKPASRD
ncbi:MAG: glycosyltransferase family 2 protein, partial [Desulfobacterota bacterium]|nr:glycosyltransferase family 2 protein [Thermodesulfobacteriota bacterium]